MPQLTADQKDKVKRYEQLKLSIISLTEEADAIKEEIFPLMDPEEKIQLTEGQLYLKPRNDWTYTPATNQLKEQFDAAKKTEQANGDATATTTYVLEYRRDKKKDEE